MKYLFVALLFLVACDSPEDLHAQILHNHIGHRRVLEKFGYSEIEFVNWNTHVCPYSNNQDWYQQGFKAKNQKNELLDGTLCCVEPAANCMVMF